MMLTKNFALFCVLSLAGSAYASYFNFWGPSDSEIESENDWSEPDVLDDDAHPVAELPNFYKIGTDIWNYWNRPVETPIAEPVETESKVVEAEPFSMDIPIAEPESEDEKTVLEVKEQDAETAENFEDVEDVDVDMAEIYEKLHQNYENGQVIMEPYEIPDSENHVPEASDKDTEFQDVYGTLHENIENGQVIREKYEIPDSETNLIETNLTENISMENILNEEVEPKDVEFEQVYEAKSEAKIIDENNPIVSSKETKPINRRKVLEIRPKVAHVPRSLLPSNHQITSPSASKPNNFEGNSIRSNGYIDNPLRGKSSVGKNGRNSLVQFMGLFLTKMEDFNLERARENLRPIPEKSSSSPSYSAIINHLSTCYMGEFDFSSIKEKEGSAAKPSRIVEIGSTDNLLPGVLGARWSSSNWNRIKDSINEFDNQIKLALQSAAPKTMTTLPSLAPKKIVERDILESWLIDGLLAAYPNLKTNLTKSDAISLILLAIFSTNLKFSENTGPIQEILTELQKYDPTFPFHKFNLESEKGELTKELFKIIDNQDLTVSSHVVKEIVAR